MERSDVEWRALLDTHKLPSLPSGVVTDARWIARSGDWWVCVNDCWYWLRGDTKTGWMPSPYGPPY